LRLLAEFENFRRRTAKESIQVRQTAARDLIADLLPVLDDFDRAASILAENPEQGVDTDGFHLIAEKFRGILKRRELTPMACKGQAFDPEEHEAITEVPAPDPELKGKVIDVIEEGYRLGDTIIRHAKVVVGK
jgi:molecular chaperone GrpE